MTTYPTSLELWHIFEKEVLRDMGMTQREKHLAAAAFWGGLCAGMIAADDTPTIEKQTLMDASKKNGALVLACVEATK